jgi:diguanylate cyclase (GGDEF)-like protein
MLLESRKGPLSPMRIHHDVCKRALESFQDEGMYLVDKDRLTIYFVGKGSSAWLGPGGPDGTAELASGHASVTLISGPEAHSLEKPPLYAPANGPTEQEPWALLCGPRAEMAEHSQVLATISPVKNESGETVGVVQVFEHQDEICRVRRRLHELERMVLLDSLTGVGNRRYGEIHLQCCLDEMRRYGWPFGVLFVDVDRFKGINDKFGHVAGDATLRLTAHTLVSCLRSSDLVVRWGGDEFVVVLKNIGKAQIGRIAEKVRSIIAQPSIPTDQETSKVTISLGATLARPSDSVASLVERADKLMYESKQAGRNRVTVDTDESLR